MPKRSGASTAADDHPAALVLAPEAPYPVAGGGPMRTASLLEYLRARYRVHVITWREPGAPDPRAVFPPGIQVSVLELPAHSKAPAARALRNLNRYVRGVPPLVDRFSGFGNEIQKIVQRRRYSLGVIEHFWCAPYVEVMRPACERLILNLHNVESVLLQRCAAGMTAPLFHRWANRCRRLEQRYLPDFDRILAASHADAAALPCPAMVYPNTIPEVPVPPVRKRFEIVFSGNLEYQPNQTAVAWFVRHVWPDLRTRCPGLSWRLAGKNEQAVRGRVDGDPRIILNGPMEDAIQVLAASSAAVVPLQSGSGTRIKIIEAWAAALPVVSTTIGAEGLPAVPGRDLLIADSPAEMTEAIVKVLQTPDLAGQLAASGRRLYEEQLTWNAAWDILQQAGF